MKEIHMTSGELNCVFSRYTKPVAYIEPGETIAMYTQDPFCGNINKNSQRAAEQFKIIVGDNPQTGPVYINGAETGDMLKISIIDILPTRDWGVSCFKPGFGGLVPNKWTPMLNDAIEDRVYVYQLKDGVYYYNDALAFSMEPFIGTIATAPAEEVIKSVVPFEQGGNMDVPDVKPGNILYLPVAVPGASLTLGDVHGKQGQGELCGVAIEITAKVTIKVDLIKNHHLTNPRIESATELMCVGSGKPMEDAARLAYFELINWMVELGWERLDAYQALSQCGKCYVGNMVDTVYSMVAKVDKEIAYRMFAKNKGK